ncbi:unnamed protein product [Pedinophyceae sp. YPF-701]|nr:unnamed protein product [Pedinophyceae sp. YPF-701]
MPAANEGQDAIKVVGVGGCGVDYLASVACYPKPDEKLRTQALEVQGGGNCGNALTAAARLGLAPYVLSQVGGDSLGDGIAAELESEGVNTAGLLREPGFPSPFTYIIVDREGGTRTCIHTPGPVLAPEAVDRAQVRQIVGGSKVVYFDGRLTEAAIVVRAEPCGARVAEIAAEVGVPILVEAERLRPNLDVLMGFADYLFTSENYPQDLTGLDSLGDAILVLLSAHPKARFVLTTLGKRGSVLVERCDASGAGDESTLDDVVAALREELDGGAGAGGGAGCVRDGGAVEVRAGGVVSTSGPVRLVPSARGDAEAKARAAAAAARAAASNARPGEADSGYGSGGDAEAVPVTARVYVAGAASIVRGDVLDTTGAGDAFMGSTLYGLAKGLPRDAMMRLGAVVAATKCTKLGARPGLPMRSEIDPELL